MATRMSDDLKEQPWGVVIKTLGDELRTFIQQEMQLVKTELSSKIKQAGVGAGMFGAAGFMGFLAAGALTAALILGLALVVPGWAAALIVAAFYGLVAGLLALSGKKKVQSATPLTPERAIQTVQSAKDQMQQAWERGTSRAAAPGPTANGNGMQIPATSHVSEPRPATPHVPHDGTMPFRSSPPRY